MRGVSGLTSRRAVLAALAAAGAAGFVPGGLGASAAATRKVRRIDMHHHFLPQRFMREEAERLHLNHGNSAMFSWTAEGAIEACDRAGVDFAVGSISTPGVWQGGIELGRKLARQWNEEAARAVHDHPTRFGFFAPIPLPDIEGALQEIDYAYGTLHADGINLLSNYDGKLLGDPAFAPVMEELDRRGALVYVHSTFAPCCGGTTVPGLGPTTLEFPFDTTRTIASLVISGTTSKFSKIRFIFSHGGGALAGIYGRLVGLDRNAALKDNFPKGMRAELAKLHYDTASLNGAATLAGLLKLAPPSQILLGSDYPLAGPPPTDVMIERAVAGFEANKPSARLKRAVEHDNAVRLLPRIARI